MATFFGSDILDDRLAGGLQDDSIFGGADGGTGGGNDVLRGGPGNDALYGGIGGDRQFGGAGDDDLFATAADLVLRGGDGVDRAIFGPGADVVTGPRRIDVEEVDLGDGDDKFVVTWSEDEGLRGPVELDDLDGTDGAALTGADANDRLGSGIVMGDFNGDGFADVAFGAPGSGPGDFGGVYVRFGGPAFAATAPAEGLDGTNGFFVRGSADAPAAGGVLAAGDVNGDGIDDLLIGVQQADFNGTDSGSVFVVLGSTGPFASTIDLTTLPGAGGFRIDGEAAGHRAGTGIAAGDLDGDGDDEAIVGATGATFGGSGSGSAYIFLGDVSTATVTVALDSSNSYRLDGGAGFGVGSSAAPLDFDGDGDLELAVGARLASGARGSTFVIDPHALNPAWIGTATVLTTLEGTSAFRLDGGAGNDQSGLPVANAGDVNGDGRDDLLIAANQAFGARGSVYVLFGTSGSVPVTTVSLSTLDGANGFRINGAAAFDGLGSAAASAGDVNQDGFGDILISASFADPNGASSGAAWVLLGKPGAWTPVVTLSTLAASDGFRLAGGAANDRAGFAVAGGGDTNGDGFDDFAVGAPQADPGGALNAGAGYVVLGGLAGTPGVAPTPMVVYGGAGDDDIEGGEGEEIIYGGEDDDLLYGGEDNDEVYGGDGRNKAFGGDGDDRVDPGVGGGSSAVGGAGTDVLAGDYSGLLAGVTMIGAGTSGRIVSGATTINFSQIEVRDIVGSDFDDLLRGGALGDRLDCGAGDDECHGWLGDDAMYGGIGNDRQYGGSGNDGIYGAAGNDSGFGGDGNDLFDCGEGDDFSNCGLGDDAGYGGAGNDVQHGGGGNDGLFGGTGNDKQYGGDGDDTFDPGSGALDSVIGGAGNDLLSYVAGLVVSSMIVSGAGTSGRIDFGGDSVVFSQIEHRKIRGGDYNDLLRGGGGNDELWGGYGDDALHGGAGDDIVDGGNAEDRLYGGEGNDAVIGGAGDDLVQGGLGDDDLWGDGADGFGDGADVFRKDIHHGNDTIKDFDAGVDKVDLIQITVSGGLGTTVVTLSDGSTLTADNGHLWVADDFR